MTPEKALAILEGKIEHKLHFQEKDLKEESAPHFFKMKLNGNKIIALIIIAGLLIGVFVFIQFFTAQISYKKGVEQGIALAKTEIHTQGEIIKQLQEDIDQLTGNVRQMENSITQTKRNLRITTQQKDRLGRVLEDTKASIPLRINATVQPLQKEIQRLIQDAQYRNRQMGEKQQLINDLNKQLRLSQHKILSTQKELTHKTNQIKTIEEKMTKMNPGVILPNSPIKPEGSLNKFISQPLDLKEADH